MSINSTPASSTRQLTKPVLMVLLGLASYSAMDALMKGLSISLGAYNAVFWRMVVGCTIACSLYFSRPRSWPTRSVWRIHLTRGCVTAAMAFGFFWGLARVPLAEAIGLSFIAPLIALYLAAVLLGESVGRRAIIASLLGLAGVIVIVSGKFGATFDEQAKWGVVAVLVSATLYAYNLVLQRQQAQVASPIDIAFFQNMIVGTIYLSLSPFLADLPELQYWPTIVAAGVLAVCSVLVLSWGYARAEAQYLVSLEYSGFVWAVIFGWAFYDEHLTWHTLVGTGLIITGCLIAGRGKRDEN